MKIITDLTYIRKVAEEREEENFEFRSFLKQIDTSCQDIDRLVHEINADISSQIDCTKCANCCQQIRPVLDQQDLSRFALGLKMSALDFQKNYLSQHERRRSKYHFKKMPCPFLKNNHCSNYAHRPEDCRSYPHLHKDDFIFRLLGVIGNYEICPIVFNVVELLKEELWWNRGFEQDDALFFDWY